MASCTKSDLSIAVKSQIFQCCNIWDSFATTDNNHEEAISDLLIENDISFTDFETIDIGMSAISVTCCQCPAGMEVKFKVNEEDLEAVLTLGFEED